MQGRKTAKGSKNRIENRSHHHHAAELKGRIEYTSPSPSSFMACHEQSKTKIEITQLNQGIFVYGYIGVYRQEGPKQVHLPACPSVS
jgi:hypothetical protein